MMSAMTAAAPAIRTVGGQRGAWKLVDGALAFAPLAFFLTGSTGEFILALPITVGIALASLFLPL